MSMMMMSARSGDFRGSRYQGANVRKGAISGSRGGKTRRVSVLVIIAGRSCC